MDLLTLLQLYLIEIETGIVNSWSEYKQSHNKLKN